MVVGGFEERQRLVSEPFRLIRRDVTGQRAHVRGDGPSQRRSDTVLRSLGARCRSVGSLDRLREIRCQKDQVDLEMDVEPVRPCQLKAAFQQTGCGREVGPQPRTLRGDRQVVAGGQRELLVGPAELVEVAARLLEVVAEDLVQLDQALAVLLEPGGEAPVEVGAGRLGEGVVGGVADQQVAEAEGVLAREQRPVRADQPLAHERSQAGRHLGLLRTERLHGASVEDLSLDRAPLEHASLCRFELVEAGGEQRPQGGRDDHLAVCLAGHRQHLLDEERVTARRASDPLAQRPGDTLGDQLLNLVLGQRLEPKRHRPGRVALRQLRPRHAKQQHRRARRKERHVLDQVAKRLLAPLDVIEHDHERRLRRSLLQRLAERPGDLLRRRRRLAFAE